MNIQNKMCTVMYINSYNYNNSFNMKSVADFFEIPHSAIY